MTEADRPETGVEALQARIAELEAELAAADEELQRFVYTASHDLKEPLRAITGFSRLMQDRYAEVLDETAMTYLRFIVGGADRLDAMIEVLLQHSRLLRHEVELHDVDLAQLVEDVLAAHPAGRDPDVEVRTGPLPTIRTDPSLATTMLANLIDNALRFRSPDRAPAVSVSCTQEGDCWVLVVEDSGIGIPPSDRERVLQLFTRLHSREEYPGHGAGLAHVAVSAQLLGGEVGIEDGADGTGTRVVVRLPVVARRATTAAAR